MMSYWSIVKLSFPLCLKKNKSLAINKTQLHRFTTFTGYFWSKETLFNAYPGGANGSIAVRATWQQ